MKKFTNLTKKSVYLDSARKCDQYLNHTTLGMVRLDVKPVYDTSWVKKYDAETTKKGGKRNSENL